MHSLEANASPASVSSQRSVVDVADCHIPVAYQDIGVAVYPQILT